MLATPDTGYVPKLEVQRTLGRASLGLVANRIWQEDPARLAVVLARYKFVATTMKRGKKCRRGWLRRCIPEVRELSPSKCPTFRLTIQIRISSEDALSQNSRKPLGH